MYNDSVAGKLRDASEFFNSNFKKQCPIRHVFLLPHMLMAPLCMFSDLLFGMRGVEMYFLLTRGPSFFHESTVTFFNQCRGAAVLLRLRYLVGRQMWEAGDLKSRGGQERTADLLFTPFLAQTLNNRAALALFNGDKQNYRDYPMEVEAHMQELWRLAEILDSKVFGLHLHDQSFQEQGNLNIPHTPCVRGSVMKLMKRRWGEYLNEDGWRRFTRQHGIARELAERGNEGRRLYESDTSDDLQVISGGGNRTGVMTRSQARKMKGNRMPSDDASRKEKRPRFRRAVFDDDDDVVMTDVSQKKHREKKRKRVSDCEVSSPKRGRYS